MGRKLEGAVPILGRELGAHLTRHRRGLYLHCKRRLDPSSRLATIDIGRKLGAMPFYGGAGSLPDTKLSGPMRSSIPTYQAAP